MDRLIVKKYLKILREGSPYNGELENPTIFLDTIGERLRICGMSAHYYMKIYINIKDDVVTAVRYNCACDPAAHVVVDTMCRLIDGKNIAAVAALTEADFIREVGSQTEHFLTRVRRMLELINRGLERHKSGAA